jgi:ABC-2 type transport system ATP-binding protein
VVVLHGGRILAEGTPAAIKQRAGGRRIRCATRLPAAGVAGLPGVTRAARRGDLLEVFTSVAEPVVRELLARDPQLAELEVAGAGLEEAFLNLTADADREGAATPGEAA